MEFILANWQLFAGVAVVAALLMFTSGGASLSGVVQVSPAKLVRMINQGQAVVFDLRSEEHYAQGHLADAQHVTADNLEGAVASLNGAATDQVVLVTDRGAATGSVIKQLKKADITHIYELKGGVQSWREEQLPLVKT